MLIRRIATLYSHLFFSSINLLVLGCSGVRRIMYAQESASQNSSKRV